MISCVKVHNVGSLKGLNFEPSSINVLFGRCRQVIYALNLLSHGTSCIVKNTLCDINDRGSDQLFSLETILGYGFNISSIEGDNSHIGMPSYLAEFTRIVRVPTNFSGDSLISYLQCHDVCVYKHNIFVFMEFFGSYIYPGLLKSVVDDIYRMALLGCQLFITTNSYLALQSFQNMSIREGLSIPFINIDDSGICRVDNFNLGMPNNAVIDEAIRLYEEEVSLTLGPMPQKIA